jgi:hypothetical protein
MKYKVEDKVVFRVHKTATSPGQRAKNVRPDEKGEFYNYEVDKYWKVRETKRDSVILETRTGKRHEVLCNNRKLRKANLIERILYKEKFNFKFLGVS